MILQPIVENAIQHGIHDDHENGIVSLTVERVSGDENETGLACIRITVSDNGVGMTKEQIRLTNKSTIPTINIVLLLVLFSVFSIVVPLFLISYLFELYLFL